MIKIAILDDNETYLSEISNYFLEADRDIACVFTATSSKEFKSKMTLPEAKDISLILVDMNLGSELGADIVAANIRQYADIDFVMLTVVEEEKLLLKSITSGASGYLLKGQSFDEIAEFIKISLSGGAAMSPSMARKLIKHFNPKEDNPSKLGLRAQRVLHYLAEGWSYKMIADDMGISIDGIRFHIKEIYRSLNVQSRTQAIRKYLDNNY